MCFVTVEIEGVRQRGRLRKTWKEVVVKDVDDLHIKNQVMLRITVNGGERLEELQQQKQ